MSYLGLAEGASAEGKQSNPSTIATFEIHTDLLFDPKKKAFLTDTSLTINPSTGLIAKVYKRTSPLPTQIAPPSIDLRGLTVLPGLVDAHTHILLHAYSETPALSQIRDESLTERTIRATNHCRTALLAGYTTYRDLGTEGAYATDTHLRNAINRGLIPGPRLFVATEALASSAGYEARLESSTSSAPRLSDPCDGPIGCRAAVRRRLGAGADVIKFYADYRKRTLRFPGPHSAGCAEIQFPPDGAERNPNLLLFNQDEMDAIVAEARSARAPVAAHATAAEAVIMAARAGVTTVEHGFERSSAALEALRENGTIFVPTLAVAELFVPMASILAHTKEAFEGGVKLACGGDTGPFAHGDNAREMELMLQAGVPLEEVLTAATLHGFEACGGEWCGRRFGWFEEGCAADVVALAGDPREEVECLRRVEFVMKDGRVWKRDGVAVGMV